MASPDYYSPLPSTRATRILIVKPSSSSDSPIECELETIDLDEKQNPTYYEALSYVWGARNATNPSKILLHGHEHTVTPNLEAALRHLRRDNQLLSLWVYAVCINQNDLSERASQVGMMADIYKKAVTTVSWLGEGDEDSDEAVELVRELGNWMSDHGSEFEDCWEEKGDSITVVQVIESLGLSLRDKNWQSVWRLFERPYWSRVWIIQELAARGDIFGRANGVFHCGAKNFSRFQFDGFCMLVLYIIHAGPNASFRRVQPASDPSSGQGTVVEMCEPTASLLKRVHPPGLRMAQVLTACRTTTKNDHRHIDWLLRLTRRFQATDPRDKLFAIRGLVTDGEIVVPNYTKPFEEVVRDFALSHIQESSSLNVLLDNKLREPSFTPSWLPEILAEDRRSGLGLAPSSQTPYHAAGSLEPVITHDSVLNVLSCRGVPVGTINKVVGPCLAGEGPGFDDVMNNYVALGHDKVFEALRQFYRRLGDDKSREIMWRTLCLDADSSDSVLGSDKVTPAPKEYGAQFRVMFGLDGGAAAIPEDLMPRDNLTQRYTSFIAPFGKGFQETIYNRTFITTQSEQVHRMGIGPYLAKEGDLVAVLFGANLCVVLRPVEGQDRYSLVGDGYIQGIMKGELVKDVSENGGQLFNLV